VFGDIDDELFKGDLLYTPIVKKWYYEVVITDIAVDGESLDLDCKKVIHINIISGLKAAAFVCVFISCTLFFLVQL
jgi:hypothetical protein